MDKDGDQLIARVQQATAADCSRWLSHPATRGLVEAGRQDVLDRLWPLIEPLVNGDETWPATFALATCAGLSRGDVTFGWPSRALSDGTIDRPVDRWLDALHDQEPTRAWRALDLIVEMKCLTQELAEKLQGAGVPILPEEPADRTPLVLLLLLHPDDLDWTHPELLARKLTFFPGFAFLAGGSAIMCSDRVSVRQQQDADRLRRAFRERQPGFSGEAVLNHGGRPGGSSTAGSVAETLISVLPQVLERFPAVTAAQLRRQWTGNGDSAGRLLRQLMGKGPRDVPPSLSTLQRALKKIRDQ
jgi:hypothetical protein